MLLIRCPYCEATREEEEFSYHGEAFIKRPDDPAALSDEQWSDYLFFRKNTRGLHAELWYHAAGCRRFFNALRDTVTYEIMATASIGEPLSESSSVDDEHQL